MKKSIILLVLLVAVSLTGFAQQKIIRYCFVKVTTSNVSSEMTARRVYVDYGQKSNTTRFKDSTVIKSIEAVREYKSFADVTNYMEAIGWTFIPGTGGVALDVVILAFKKEFDKSEIVVK